MLYIDIDTNVDIDQKILHIERRTFLNQSHWTINLMRNL